MPKRTIKAWAVVWTVDSMKEYGVEEHPILYVETKEELRFNVSKGKMGRPKMRITEPMSIFDAEDEAEAFRKGNNDFKVIPVTISYSVPKKIIKRKKK